MAEPNTFLRRGRPLITPAVGLLEMVMTAVVLTVLAAATVWTVAAGLFPPAAFAAAGP